MQVPLNHTRDRGDASTRVRCSRCGADATPRNRVAQRLGGVAEPGLYPELYSRLVLCDLCFTDSLFRLADEVFGRDEVH